MILLPSQWHDFYHGIREDQHTTSEKKISIFVNGTDCDSLCSLKLLQVCSRVLPQCPIAERGARGGRALRAR